MFNITKSCLRIFWPHFEKQDGCLGHFFVSHEAVHRDFLVITVTSRVKGIISRVRKFADVHYYKSVPGSSFGLILKNNMAAVGISLMISQDFYTFWGFFSSMEGCMSLWLFSINIYISSIAYRYLTLSLASFSKTRWLPLVFF